MEDFSLQQLRKDLKHYKNFVKIYGEVPETIIFAAKEYLKAKGGKK